MRRAAVEAAKQWKFEALMSEGQPKPYLGILELTVSWDNEQSGKQCPKEKREAQQATGADPAVSSFYP